MSEEITMERALELVEENPGEAEICESMYGRGKFLLLEPSINGYSASIFIDIKDEDDE